VFRTPYTLGVAYSREDIDRVRDRTDLAELAAEVTKVRRSGRSVMAVCPFHQEKTPSLSIDAARGLFHCFGCGKSGDVFQWVQETQSTDFVGALELLARRANVTLTEDPTAKRRRGRRESLVSATQLALEFFNDQLKKSPEAGRARSYLRSRGYDGDVVERFKLGYSPDTWDSLIGHLKDEGINTRTMEEAGLISKSRQGRPIDRFRGRLMFPIYDLRGDAVGFGARILDGDGPKYLNSPETPIYRKSNLLYGLNWAKGAIVREGEAVVVEGYTDVIALHLADHPVAVASCGTALGDEHLDLLRRFSEKVVLAFDGDAAGANAALRGFDLAVPADIDLRVTVFPDGKDPADLVSDGRIADVRKAIAESLPLLRFRLDAELEKYNLSEPEGRGRAVRAVGALIATHPDAVTRREYAVLVARRTGVERSLIEDAIRKAVRTKQRPPSGGQSRRSPVVTGYPEDEGPDPSPPAEDVLRLPTKLTGNQKAEQELLRLLAMNDPLVRDTPVDESWFSLPIHVAAYRLLFPGIETAGPGGTVDLGSLITGNSSPEAALVAALAMSDRPLADSAELVNRLKVGGIDRRIHVLRMKLDTLSSEEQEYSMVFEELIALERERRMLRSSE
jgi:DNA primase